MTEQTYRKGGLEKAKAGFANGISSQLYKKNLENGELTEPLSNEEKQEIIDNAAEAYGKFLDALGVDWEDDPNSDKTPYRVAKAYVNDLWAGRYDLPPTVTSFPSDGYDGIVQESNIPITSMCSHHHQTISGNATVAYIPEEGGNVIGLSKLNRLVEHFARRGAIQEQLTIAIHHAVGEIIGANAGVAVMVTATHNCVQCRGVKHKGASMQTTKLSGAFKDDPATRSEFYKNIEIANQNS
jgi:GTP cyclohydrolase I